MRTVQGNFAYNKTTDQYGLVTRSGVFFAFSSTVNQLPEVRNIVAAVYPAAPKEPQCNGVFYICTPCSGEVQNDKLVNVHFN